MPSSKAGRVSLAVIGTALILGSMPADTAPADSNWSYWRGPAADGMAVGDAPLNWSATENVRWKIDIPGLGNSSPVVWGDFIFVTTAIKTGAASTPDAAPFAVPPPPPPLPPGPPPGRQGFGPPGGRRAGGPGGGGGPQVEHKFDLLALDRKTGKILWQRTAKTAVPHEGGHNTYGSFASNSPVTDGKYVYAFFGSRGMYCYDFRGTLVWEKDFGVQMRMKMGFGEGMAPVLAGDKLILVFDHEDDSFMVVLDKRTGKEVWRVSRDEKSNWAAPLVATYQGRQQVVVAATKKVRSYDLETGKLLWECAGIGPCRTTEGWRDGPGDQEVSPRSFRRDRGMGGAVLGYT